MGKKLISFVVLVVLLSVLSVKANNDEKTTESVPRHILSALDRNKILGSTEFAVRENRYIQKEIAIWNEEEGRLASNVQKIIPTAITMTSHNFFDREGNFVKTIPKNAVVYLREMVFGQERILIEYEGVTGTILSGGLETNFIEVNIDLQQISMYLNGELMLRGPVVTGTANTGRATPRGMFSVQYKAMNVVLEGPGYASPVKYWMPIYGGIGIHDADGWRSAYGGDIYLYSGSHGCINVPGEIARTIYENTYSGMLVIVK